MTAEAAIYSFFSSFGITAYAETSVPEDVTYPFLTYTGSRSPWNGAGAGITVNLWYYTESEKIPNDKANEIYDVLKHGGVSLPCDDGVVWLVAGDPFCQSLVDDADRNIKRRYINITRYDLRE